MKILILAQSGFGKTTSMGHIPEVGIKGLNPKSTFLITTTAKELPWRGGHKDYKTWDKPLSPEIFKSDCNRVVTNNPAQVAMLLSILTKVDKFKDVVYDDSNFTMQDHYAKNAMMGGFEVFKEIGIGQGKIYDAIKDSYSGPDKNLWVMAHPEMSEDIRPTYIMKTVGKMVRNTMTPEGKFDMIFIGKVDFDDLENKATRTYITGEHENLSGAKSFIGMFDKLEIPNDLGYIKDKIKEYYK
jgi:hypothetical protein